MMEFNEVMERIDTEIALTVDVRPIGQLLLENQSILLQDLEFALEHQRYSRELLGEILIRMRALDRKDLDAALALQRKVVSR